MDDPIPLIVRTSSSSLAFTCPFKKNGSLAKNRFLRKPGEEQGYRARGHPFSTHSEFFEKLTYLTP